MSFEVLPLIEFKPSEGVTHSRVIDLLNTEKKHKTKQTKGGDGWNQNVGANQQVLSFGGMVGGIFDFR